MAGFLKRFWPLVAFFILLVAIGLFFLAHTMLPGPQAAVEGYIEASLHYDVDGMLFFASDYQKKALAGNADISEDRLRDNLKKFYSSGAVSAETAEITFSGQSVTAVDPKSERYHTYLHEYGYKADPGAVNGMAVVTLTSDVGGRRAHYRVVAVKLGLRWYYGFPVFE